MSDLIERLERAAATAASETRAALWREGAGVSHDVELKAFARLVRDMRRLQKRFFEGEKSVVSQAKDLERRVDRVVDQVLDDQPHLFE